MRYASSLIRFTHTQPVDPATAGNPASYARDAFTDIYQAKYGSPEGDQATPTLTAAAVSPDKKSVLKIDGLVRGHMLRVTSLRRPQS